MNIYEKLIEVRKVVPYLQKESKGYQFNYTGSSLVLGSLKAKMDELGLLLIPRVVSKEVSEHETQKGGKEYFTELCMEFTWVNADAPEEIIVCPWYGQGLDNGEKGVGKAMTYAEKYFMLKFFNIATDKDDPDSFQKKMGDDTPAPKAEKTPAPKQTKQDKPENAPNPADKIDQKGMAALHAKAKEINMPHEVLSIHAQDKYGVSSLTELTMKQGRELYAFISKPIPKVTD